MEKVTAPGIAAKRCGPVALAGQDLQMPKLKIGTRGSPLALYQANETKSRLIAAHGMGEDDIEIVVITTTGDRVRDRPLSEIGGKGLFTKEIEEALFAKDIHLAVHSMKDMPAQLPAGLVMAALLPREDPRDAFLSPVARSIHDLEQGATVGSSSVRRAAQLKRLRPDLNVIQFRGNVETRLRKLSDGVAQATFLACAGLNRLGLQDKITSVVPTDVMLPAVAQGCIGIETRDDDDATRAFLAPLNHAETAFAVHCERAFLAALDGSCRTPLAGHATYAGGRISFRGHALTPDGVHCFETTREGVAADAAYMGREAGEEVKATGGSLIAF
jgi:hydroxymethylbilane synthase